MNAVEIRNLSKTYGKIHAVDGLNMTVPAGAIYGFIGENGSGKSTTEKMICGLIHPQKGNIQIYGRDYTDPDVRSRIGVLIETPGCYPNVSVYNNLRFHAENLGLRRQEEEIGRVLKLVRMEGSAASPFQHCSLGMKQRIGIAMALMGNPDLLVLDEPVNGLDADGMRIMRDVLTDITKNNCTVLVSSHILGELEKIATHYGIIRHGRMVREMTAGELENDCRTYVAVKTKDAGFTKMILQNRYFRVEEDEEGYIRIYDDIKPENAVSFLYENGILCAEVKTARISLEEYYIDLMEEKG